MLCTVVTAHHIGGAQNTAIENALAQGGWKTATVNVWRYNPQDDWNAANEALIFAPGEDCATENLIIGFAAVASARARGCRAMVLGNAMVGRHCDLLAVPHIEAANQIIDALEDMKRPSLPARHAAPAGAPEAPAPLYVYTVNIPGAQPVQVTCDGIAIEETGVLVCVRAGRVVFSAAPGGWLNVSEKEESKSI